MKLSNTEALLKLVLINNERIAEFISATSSATKYTWIGYGPKLISVPGPGITKGGRVYPLFQGKGGAPTSNSKKGSPCILFKSKPISSLISSPSNPENNPFCNPKETLIPGVIHTNLNFWGVGSYTISKQGTPPLRTPAINAIAKL